MRERLGDGDVAITRPNARASSILLGQDAADLVAEFREPGLVVQAVLRYCAARDRDPGETLTEAFPLLRRLVSAGFLVHQVRLPDGGVGALKLARRPGDEVLRRRLVREADLLAAGSARVPACLACDLVGERPWLLLSWVAGAPLAQVAAELRATGDRVALRALLVDLARAYAELHQAGVLHGDVHPGNLVVTADGSVRILDLGLGRRVGGPAAERGGVAFYFEPEYAAAALGRRRLPGVSAAGEQFAVGAMLFQLATGAHHADFSLVGEDVLLAIRDAAPRAFADAGAEPWPALEAVLGRALAKAREARFGSMQALAEALAEVEIPASRSSRPHDAFDEVVSELVERASPDGTLWASGFEAPHASVNLGAGGIAWALYRIACAQDDPALLSLADGWLARAMRSAVLDGDAAFLNPDLHMDRATIGLASTHHGLPGLHALDALLAVAVADDARAAAAAAAFATTALADCAPADVTLGRGSALVTASELLLAVPAKLVREQ